MEARGGCCIARYDGTGYVGSKMDQIMLRFRPIAPKPAGLSAPGPAVEKPDSGVRGGAAKTRRRNVRESKRCRKQRKASPEGVDDTSKSPIVTLTLLPESAAVGEKSPPSDPSSYDLPLQYHPIWYSPAIENLFAVGSDSGAPVVAAPRPVRPSWSLVTVELVTDACLESMSLGNTDEEMRSSLEADTCPGFLADACNRVWWANEAYRRMVGQEGSGGEAVVRVITKERLPESGVAAFTCRVRVQYTCEKERNSLTVPCDVWRMSDGSCVWRLDMEAALSLGR